MNTQTLINDRIKARLNEIGLSARQAAIRVGLAPSTLTRPLNNPDHKFWLSTSTLSKLCAVLEISLVDLVDDEGATPLTRAARLRHARERSTYASASDAARSMDVPIPTYVSHENGHRDFDDEAGGLYAETFGVPLAWLMLGEISPNLGASGGNRQTTRLTALRDEIETAFDLLTALDKTGDGIGGDIGHGVSAVALAARAALDNARSMIRAMEGGR